MKKMGIFLITGTLLMIMPAFLRNTIKSFHLKIPFIMQSQMRLPCLSVTWDLKSKVFISIVLIVTTVVVAYREMYIEHYNNKKFINMLTAFLMSIIILASRERVLNVILGWEILGLRSLMLIIFYPNKTGKFNSILTIFFNRIGDVILILILRKMIIRNQVDLSTALLKKREWVLLAVCALTKRAQFPISAWLPAAISAPTPISAMVHSSTLVTAGIFLVMTAHEPLGLNGVIPLVVCTRIVRFIIGGVIRSVERDYKKIIAFSTIRQISIIIHFATAPIIMMSLTHIVYHAIFKTLLFCVAGIMFITVWGLQARNEIAVKRKKEIIYSIMAIRIFSITGLIFSASFFSKDLYLEEILIRQRAIIGSIFIIMASFMTIIYCIKIIQPIIKKEKIYMFEEKKTVSIHLTAITVITLIIASVRKLITMKENIPLIRREEVILIVVILILTPILMKKLLLEVKILINFTNDVAFMKFSIYSIISGAKSIAKTMEREIMMIKKYYLVKREVKGIRAKRIYPAILPVALICVIKLTR